MKSFVLIPSLMASLFAIGVNAGNATVVGSANLSVPPDYVEVSISINSTCFKTRDELKSAHDQVVSSLQKALKGIVGESTATNGVSTNGGYSGPYSHTIYEGSTSREVCQGTFQKSSSITVKSSNFEQFSDLFDSINGQVDEAVKGKEGSPEKPRISASVGTPYSQICSKTRSEMEAQALTAARKDAERKFWALLAGTNTCSAQGKVELVKISPPNYSSGSPRGYSKSAESAFNDSGSPIEVTIENINVSVSYEFVFEYEGCAPFQTMSSNVL